MKAKEFLHSDEMSEWDTIFDQPVKCEYTEEQLIRFAEIWSDKKLLKELEDLISVFPFTPIEMDKKIKNLKQKSLDQYDGNTRTGGLAPDTGPRA
tara:strand:- start:113 stop:397 length:285 start_codon:yes stop_codon:yes gene_type:complete